MELPATKSSEKTTARPMSRIIPLQVAEHLLEHLAEGLLGLGAGRVVAVAIEVVDLLAETAAMTSARWHLMKIIPALPDPSGGVDRDPQTHWSSTRLSASSKVVEPERGTSASRDWPGRRRCPGRQVQVDG